MAPAQYSLRLPDSILIVSSLERRLGDYNCLKVWPRILLEYYSDCPHQKTSANIRVGASLVGTGAHSIRNLIIDAANSLWGLDGRKIIRSRPANLTSPQPCSLIKNQRTKA